MTAAPSAAEMGAQRRDPVAGPPGCQTGGRADDRPRDSAVV